MTTSRPLAPVTVASTGIKERAVSASLSTKLQGRGGRFMPDGAKAALHRRMAEPGAGRR